MIDKRLERILNIWRIEASTYTYSTSISTTLAQAYAIKVLGFNVDLLGLMVSLQIGSVSLGFLVGSLLLVVFRRKRILLWKLFGAVNRILWAIIGFTHLLPIEAKTPFFLASIATAQFTGSIAGLASGDVGADLVSRERAIKFFSSLNSLTLLASCLGLATATVIFNFLLLNTVEAYTIAYSVALASSIISTIPLALLEDLNPVTTRVKPVDALREYVYIARSQEASNYLKLVTIFMAMVNLPGALWNYYLLTVFKGSESWITLKAVVANLSQAVGFRVWGEISRRIGVKKTLYTGIFLTVPVPVIFIYASTLPAQLAMEAYSGFIWAAYNLANNIYTLYLPRRESRVHFITLLNLSFNAAAAVATRLGASIASLGLMEMNAVFIASTLGRVVAGFIARSKAPRLIVEASRK